MFTEAVLHYSLLICNFGWVFISQTANLNVSNVDENLNSGIIKSIQFTFLKQKYSSAIAPRTEQKPTFVRCLDFWLLLLKIMTEHNYSCFSFVAILRRNRPHLQNLFPILHMAACQTLVDQN